MAREWFTEAWLKVKALVKRRRLERDLEEELQFHLAMRAEKNRALGLGADDGRVAARRRFGNVALVKEDCREMWILSWAETFWQDVGYAGDSGCFVGDSNPSFGHKLASSKLPSP